MRCSTMRRSDYMIGIGVGALVGLVVGYFAGAFLGCKVLYPESNLCGIVGVFVTGPAFAVAGAVAMWRIGRDKITD